MGSLRSRLTEQTGSLHVIIIVVLFIALMGTLGVVFYQNVIEKKQVTVQSDGEKENTLTTKRVAFESNIYNLEYPKEWKLETKDIEDSTAGGTSTIISSPSKNIQAIFTIHEQASDNVCDVTDGLKISSYSVDKSPVNDLTDVPVYLVEAIVDSPGGGYQYKIGLVPDGGATNTSIGESHCIVRNVGFASTAIVGINKLAKPTIIAMINLPTLQPKADIAIKSMKEIKDLMANEDYKTAINIIKSAYKE